MSAARVRDERRVEEEVVGSRLSESAQKARSGPRATCSASGRRHSWKWAESRTKAAEHCGKTASSEDEPF